MKIFTTPASRMLWVAMFVLSVAGLIDVAFAPVFGFSTFERALFLISVSSLSATVSMLLCTVAWRFRAGRVAASILVFLSATLAIINATGYLLYGFGISRKLIGLFAQTNSGEVGEFIPDLLRNLASGMQTPVFWGCIAVIASLFISARYVRPKIFAVGTLVLSCIGLCDYTVFALNNQTGRTSICILLRTAKYIQGQSSDNRKMHEYIANRTRLPQSDSVSSQHRATTVAVIVGESANKSSLSIYGYPLPTSPYMDMWRDSLFVLTDALASSQITYPNLERLLSFQSDHSEEGDTYKYPALFDLFNAAGYKSYWLSNQERVSDWNLAVSALTSAATVEKYVGMEYIDDTMLANSTTDEALLPEARKAFADTCANKLVMLHLMGSHIQYDQRYPTDRRYFTADSVLRHIHKPWLDRNKAEIVAQYANSIRFTDSIWHEVASEIAGMPGPAVLVYLSDHGENVYENGNYRRRTRQNTKIPFVIYANRAYREQNPEIIEAIRRGIDRPFSSSALVYIISTLTGTNHPTLYNGNDDPLSDSFVERVRYVDGEAYP